MRLICFEEIQTKLIGSISYEGTLRVWDIDSGRVVKALYSEYEGDQNLSWSPDSKSLAICGGRYLDIYETDSWEHFVTLEGPLESISCVTWSPNGQTVISGSDMGIISIQEISLPNLSNCSV